MICRGRISRKSHASQRILMPVFSLFMEVKSFLRRQKKCSFGTALMTPRGCGVELHSHGTARYAREKTSTANVTYPNDLVLICFSSTKCAAVNIGRCRARQLNSTNTAGNNQIRRRPEQSC